MKRIRLSFIVVGLTCFTSAGLFPSIISQARPEQLPERDETETKPIGAPLEKLPAHVKAAKGELTLFADFDRKTDEGVPVYLVNRTGKSIILNHQDSDLYLKIEYESAPNQWTRAEPHAFSFCGNSYLPCRRIDDESFAIRFGSFPTNGTKAKVRYSLYRQAFQVASNTTSGFVKPEDVRKAANDRLAIYSGSFEFVSKVARGEIQLKNEVEDASALRECAIRQFREERFPRAEAKKVLQTIAEGSEKRFAEEAAYLLLRMKEKE